MVSALKWVDEVIPNAPYAITEDFMNKLFTEYNIDYIIHGDDPCLLPDGTDAYALAKKAGRYKQIKRTEGVSSTDIVGSSSILFWHNVQFCLVLLFNLAKYVFDSILYCTEEFLGTEFQVLAILTCLDTILNECT